MPPLFLVLFGALMALTGFVSVIAKLSVKQSGEIGVLWMSLGGLAIMAAGSLMAQQRRLRALEAEVTQLRDRVAEPGRPH